MKPPRGPEHPPAVVRIAVVLGTLAALGCGGGDTSVGPGPGGPPPQSPGTPHRVEIAPVAAPRTAVPGGPIEDPVMITVRDAAGTPIPNTGIVLEVVAGAGWVVDPNPRTDPQGRATLSWYAGPEPDGGLQRLRVRAGPAVAEIEALAIPAVVGETYLGHRAFVSYEPGTLPVVITASHGGTMLPSDLPDRGFGVLTRDLATDTLAYLLAEALETQSGSRPHLVVVHLHRRKLDANRDVGEGAQGNPAATRAWLEFHAWTEAALQVVRATHPRGLYLDLHGHGHEVQRIELGYLVSGADLALPDSLLDQPEVGGRSSVREVTTWSGLPPSAVLRGQASLGAWFHEEGYAAVPSPDDPHPSGAPYFSGGYNTRRYGCRDGGTVCGFQLEANRIGVRDSPANLEAFAAATARVIVRFLERYAAADPSGSPQP